MRKKVEEYIYLVIFIIVIAVVASAFTYIIIMSKEAKEVKDNNANEIKDTITLSESELEEYLSYVPKYEVYDVESITINDISNDDLIAYVGINLYNDYLVDTNYESESKIPISVFNNTLKKFYNKEVSYRDTNNSEPYWINGTAVCFYYTSSNDYIHGLPCAGGYGIYSTIDNYIATEDTLLMYVYTAYEEFQGCIDVENCIDHYYLKDFQNGYSLNDDLSNGVWGDALLEKYKTNFTKYKHTFKKNDTGYYWYSTEIVD